MKDLLVFIRSATAGSIGLSATLLNSIFVILSTPFGDKVQYKFVRGWAHTCHFAMRYATGISYEVINNHFVSCRSSTCFRFKTRGHVCSYFWAGNAIFEDDRY